MVVQVSVLQTHGIDRLKLTENDSALLKGILEMRLSEQAVRSVENNTTTQKNEAFNSGLLSNLPKNINNSKNFRGKLASKALQINNNIQSSVEKKTKAITGRTLSRPALKGLKALSRSAERQKSYQRTCKFKKHRIRNRARMEHNYHNARMDDKYTNDYVKGQLDAMGVPT